MNRINIGLYHLLVKCRSHAHLCLRFCFSIFRFLFFYASAWHRKLAQVLICIPYTPTPDYPLPPKPGFGV